MSDENNTVTDKASEIAKNIWLAGLGAYGKAVEDAQGRLGKALEPPKLFRDLVRAGTALEEDAKGSTAAARHSVEDRINRVRENFQNQRPARIEDLTALHKKVDQLTRKVNLLSKALAEQRTDDRPLVKTAANKKRATAASSSRKGTTQKITPRTKAKVTAKKRKA